jgi:hypothetical protein
VTLGTLSAGRTQRAHAIVTAFAAGSGPGAWRLERSIVARRLHDLIDEPDLLQQGDLNLCGPAAFFVVWLRHDPEAVATCAAELFRAGRSTIGPGTGVRPTMRGARIEPSAALLAVRHDVAVAESGCPAADWLLMSALRDSTNRTLRYTHRPGLREAAAAITLPGALRRWLTATGLFGTVRDDTALVRRTPPAHARRLAPGHGRELPLLVAQEMFARPQSVLGRARDRVVGRLPNHWLLLRSPVSPVGTDRVTFRYWSWGAEQMAVLSRATFARSYHGCLDAVLAADR